MFESRVLGPNEGALLAGASANLVEQAGTWYRLGPARADESLDVLGFEVLIAGPDLLSRFDTLGTGAQLEIGFDLADRFGHVHDVSRSTLLSVETAAELDRGTHGGTHVDASAATEEDGTPRAGLRGVRRLGGAPADAVWESKPIDLRGRRAVHRVVWEVDDVRDRRGRALHRYHLIARIGTRSGTAVSWSFEQEVTQPPVAGDVAGVDLVGAPEGDVLQWSVRLPYVTSDASAYSEHVNETATVFLLGAWVSVDSRWTFPSLASIAGRSELSPRIERRAWRGTDDLAVFRMTAPAFLRGAVREAVRARVAGNPAGLSMVSVTALAEIRFDEVY